MELDSTKYSKETIQKTLSFFNNAFTKHHSLEFNAVESIYKELPQKRLSKNLTNDFISNKLYVNFKNQKYIHQKEFLNKFFLIKDKTDSYKWKIGKTKKRIGKYLCIKATTKLRKTKIHKGKLIEQYVNIIAWFTPDISIKMGPSLFNGLPGLILEVTDGEVTIVCDTISLKKDRGFNIKIPKKGKVISQFDFDQVQLKKSLQQNRMNNFRNTIEKSKY